MVLFIVTPGYRHHFRPRRANDSMPVQPLVDTLLYWLCTAFGGLFVSIGLVALLANLIEDVTFEPTELIVIGIMTALAPPLFFVAYRAYRKLQVGSGL